MNTTRTTYALAFGVAAMMAVGRIYDARLNVAGLDLSLLISAAYAAVVLLGASGVIGAVRPSGYAGLRAGPSSGGYTFPMVLIAAWAAVYVVLVPAYDAAYTDEKLVTFALVTLPSALLVARQRDAGLVGALAVALACVGGAMLLMSLPSIAGALTGRMGYGRAATRLSLFGGGPIVYARWVLTAALVVALSRAPLVVKGAVVGAALLAAVLAQSKGPVLFFGVSLGLVALLRALAQRRVSRATLVVSGGVLFALVGPRLITALGLGGRLLTLFSPDQLLATTSSTARIDLLRVSLEMIRDHPLGVGLGNWATAASRYVISGTVLSYPHNLFVEVAAELGVALAVGLALWVLWYGGKSVHGLAGMLRRGHPHAGLGLTALALFLFYLLNSLVSGDLSDARLMFVALAMLGVAAADARAGAPLAPAAVTARA